MKIRIKKRTESKRRDAFDLWNHEYRPANGDDYIQFPGGNPKGGVLVLLPVPSAEVYQQNFIMADPAVQEFHELLKGEVGLDLHDCVVAPCVRHGVKALKGNTADVMQWVQRCVQRKLFKLIVCVGGDATKWIINGGKKANLGSLSGQLMYPKEINHTPLFLFPDIRGLLFEPHPDRRENWFRQQAANSHRRRLVVIAQILSAHLQEMFPQF